MNKTGIAVIVSSLSMIGIGGMLYMTRPGEVGPFGVLAFFILVYLLCVSFIFLLLNTTASVVKKYLPNGRLKLWLESLSVRKIYYYASALGLAPVVTIGMASVGRVSGVDLILVLIFEMLACFYISRRF